MDSELLYLLAQTAQTRVPVGRLTYSTANNVALPTSATQVAMNTTTYLANGMSLGSTTGSLQVPLTGYYSVNTLLTVSASSTTGLTAVPSNSLIFTQIVVGGTVYAQGYRAAPNAGVYRTGANDIIFAYANSNIAMYAASQSGAGMYYYTSSGDATQIFLSVAYLSA